MVCTAYEAIGKVAETIRREGIDDRTFRYVEQVARESPDDEERAEAYNVLAQAWWCHNAKLGIGRSIRAAELSEKAFNIAEKYDDDCIYRSNIAFWYIITTSGTPNFHPLSAKRQLAWRYASDIPSFKKRFTALMCLLFPVGYTRLTRGLRKR